MPDLLFQSGLGVPATTKGDLVGFDTAPNRVPVGANGKILTADSTQSLGLKWGDGPLTTKGDLAGFDTGINRLAVGTDGQILTADSTQSLGVKWAAPFTNSYELINLGLSTSVGSNALTIALKQSDGSTDPSTGASAVKLGFRSSTATSGAYNERSVTAALSVVIPSGTTIGTANGIAHFIYVYALDNAGTVELAVSLALFDEGARQTSTSISGGSSATTLYSTTGRSNVPIRLIGRITISEATAGTWASGATLVAVNPFRDEKVFLQYSGNGGAAQTGGTTNIDWDTKIVDSHSAWSGNNTFTAPRSAFYLIQGMVKITVATNTEVDLYKNGSLNIDIGDVGAASTKFMMSGGIFLFTGETLNFRLANNATLQNNNANQHWISICSQG